MTPVHYHYDSALLYKREEVVECEHRQLGVVRTLSKARPYTNHHYIVTRLKTAWMPCQPAEHYHIWLLGAVARYIKALSHQPTY